MVATRKEKILSLFRKIPSSINQCTQGYTDVTGGIQSVVIFNLYYKGTFLFVNFFANNVLILNPVYDLQIVYDKDKNIISYSGKNFVYLQDERLYLRENIMEDKDFLFFDYYPDYYWTFDNGTIKDNFGRYKWTISEERDENRFLSKIVKIEDVNVQDCVSNAWVIKKSLDI
jgi:hypothetical protein